MDTTTILDSGKAIVKNKVEIKYVSDDFGYWELTVNNKFLGQKVVRLDHDNAMVIAIAIATVRDIGIKEGQEKAMKKYKAIADVSNIGTTWTSERTWEDANTPQYWNPEWKLNDPRK